MENETSYRSDSLTTYCMIGGQSSLTYDEKQKIVAMTKYQYGENKIDIAGLELIDRYVIVRPAIILSIDEYYLRAAHISEVNFCYLGAVMKKNGLLILLQKQEGSFCQLDSLHFENFYVDYFYTPVFGGLDVTLTLFQEEKLNFLPEKGVVFKPV